MHESRHSTHASVMNPTPATQATLTWKRENGARSISSSAARRRSSRVYATPPAGFKWSEPWLEVSTAAMVRRWRGWRSRKERRVGERGEPESGALSVAHTFYGLEPGPPLTAERGRSAAGREALCESMLLPTNVRSYGPINGRLLLPSFPRASLDLPSSSIFSPSPRLQSSLTIRSHLAAPRALLCGVKILQDTPDPKPKKVHFGSAHFPTSSYPQEVGTATVRCNTVFQQRLVTVPPRT